MMNHIFDKCVIVGSNNLSKASENLTEVALLTDLPTTISACRSLIEMFKKTGIEIDEAFISRITKLPVTKTPFNVGGGKHGVKQDPKARTWLVGLKPIVKEKPDDIAFGEKGLAKAEKKTSNKKSTVSQIVYSGVSRFRVEAKAGDSVVTIWTGEGSNKPDYVYHHAPIILREDNPDTGKTHLYVEDYPDADDTTLTWKQFQKLYSRIGIPGKLGQWSHREIAPNFSDALHELWFDQK